MSWRPESYRDEAYRKAVNYQHTVYGDDGKFRVRGFIQAISEQMGKPGKYFLWASGVWFLWYRCTNWAIRTHVADVDELKRIEEQSFRESGATVKSEDYLVRHWGVTSTSEDDISKIPLFTRSRIRNPIIKYKDLENISDETPEKEL